MSEGAAISKSLLVLVLLRTRDPYIISRETFSRILILSSYVRMEDGSGSGGALIRFVPTSSESPFLSTCSHTFSVSFFFFVIFCSFFVYR